MKESKFRQLLIGEYSKRRISNKQYSIRAFARDLGVCKSSLSYALSGERELSQGTKQKISRRLALSPSQMKTYMDDGIEYREVEEDAFRTIANWYCFAIYGLLQTPGANLDADWISERLGLSKLEAKDGIDRLLRLGLIKKNGEAFVQTKQTIKTSEDVWSRALQKHHKQNLQRAAQSLDSVALDLREFTSITVPVDPENLLSVKKEIRNFRDRMLKKLKKDNPKEVYTLAIQYFPQTKVQEER